MVKLFVRDLIVGFRRLSMAPSYTAFAVTVLALSIGTTVAVYSVVDSAVLQPPSIRDVGGVVNIYPSGPLRGRFSVPDIQTLAERQTSFSEVAAWARFRYAVGAEVGL